MRRRVCLPTYSTSCNSGWCNTHPLSNAVTLALASRSSPCHWPVTARCVRGADTSAVLLCLNRIRCDPIPLALRSSPANSSRAYSTRMSSSFTCEITTADARDLLEQNRFAKILSRNIPINNQHDCTWSDPLIAASVRKREFVASRDAWFAECWLCIRRLRPRNEP